MVDEVISYLVMILVVIKTLVAIPSSIGHDGFLFAEDVKIEEML